MMIDCDMRETHKPMESEIDRESDIDLAEIVDSIEHVAQSEQAAHSAPQEASVEPELDAVASISFDDLPTMQRTRNRNIMYRLIAGQRPAQIAEELGLAIGSISKISNSPLFKQELRKLEEQIEARLTDPTSRFRNAAPSAVNKILEIMMIGTNGQKEQRLAARDVLLFGGFKPAEKKEVTHHHDFGGTIKRLAAREALLKGGAPAPTHLSAAASELSQTASESSEQAKLAAEASEGSHEVKEGDFIPDSFETFLEAQVARIREQKAEAAREKTVETGDMAARIFAAA